MTPSANSVFPGSSGPDEALDQRPDPELSAARELARRAAAGEAGDEPVGEYVGAEPEGEDAVTHLFEANLPGYRGWRWAVTVSHAGPDDPITVSEVVLLPGPDALVAPAWVPWQQRVQAGDLGVGDLMPAAPDDVRLVPGYLQSDDPAVEEVATEIGLGRARVLSRFGRSLAAERWHEGDFGPGSDMARGAPDHCGTCGFYLPLAGSMRAAFGVCGNEIAPADGRVVHVAYGCGAHSEVEIAQGSPVPVADLVYDDTGLDTEPRQAPEAAPDEGKAVEETPVEAPAEVVVPDQAVAETAPAAEALAEPVAPAESPDEAAPAAETEVAPVEETPAEPEVPAEAAAPVEPETLVEAVVPAEAPAEAAPVEAQPVEAEAAPEAAEQLAEPTTEPTAERTAELIVEAVPEAATEPPPVVDPPTTPITELLAQVAARLAAERPAEPPAEPEASGDSEQPAGDQPADNQPTDET